MLDQRVWSLTPHFVSYTVCKAGLWALTQSMALALAPRIRVKRHRPRPGAAQRRARTRSNSPGRRDRCRWATAPSPAEIGRAVLAILALPAMTGQMLALDGGQHLQWSSRMPARSTRSSIAPRDNARNLSTRAVVRA